MSAKSVVARYKSARLLTEQEVRQAAKLVGVDRLRSGDVIEHEGKEIRIKGWYPTKVDGRSMMGFKGLVVSEGRGDIVELVFGAGDKVKLLRRE